METYKISPEIIVSLIVIVIIALILIYIYNKNEEEKLKKIAEQEIENINIRKEAERAQREYEARKKREEEEKAKEQEKAQYPYKKKHMLTKTEYDFYKILKSKCDTNNLLICPKVRLEDFIETTATTEKLKYRGYIKSRHVDFILCNDKLKIIAAIELDDYTHNTKKAEQTDAFKNLLFATIGIPLHRIIVGKDYNEQLDKILPTILH